MFRTILKLDIRGRLVEASIPECFNSHCEFKNPVNKILKLDIRRRLVEASIPECFNSHCEFKNPVNKKCCILHRAETAKVLKNS